MIVGQLNVPSFAIPPYETQPPLIIDANAVLTVAIAAQHLQTVAWGHPQIVKLPRGINCRTVRLSRRR
jgi:hypothetical protein